jgi:ribosomal-protein-alanine N-acetyltransferase
LMDRKLMESAPFLAKSKPPSDVHVRWLVRRDLPEVLEIERASFPCGWDEDYLLKFLRTREVIGHVAETPSGRVVGYMIYLLGNREIRLLRLAVHPDSRRSGVGRALVEKARNKVGHRRPVLTIYVRESNLGACKFYNAAGIPAVAVLPGHYGDEDGYLFEYAALPEGGWMNIPEDVP